jgi:hypothetical protein
MGVKRLAKYGEQLYNSFTCDVARSRSFFLALTLDSPWTKWSWSSHMSFIISIAPKCRRDIHADGEGKEY